MCKNKNFFQEPKVEKWLDKLKSSGCVVNSVKPLHTVRKKDDSLLFALAEADVISPEGYKLLPVIFLRGSAVVVVPYVKNTETNESAFLMIKQRRIAFGESNLEFPAGMTDNNIGKETKTALIELKEETGVSVKKSSLFKICNRPLYSSAGASDEAITYFGTIIELSDVEYKSLEGRFTGLESENEHIEVTMRRNPEREQAILSTQTMLAIYLFRDYCHRNGIQL